MDPTNTGATASKSDIIVAVLFSGKGQSGRPGAMLQIHRAVRFPNNNLTHEVDMTNEHDALLKRIGALSPHVVIAADDAPLCRAEELQQLLSTESSRTYSRGYRRRKVAAGLCTICTEPAVIKENGSSGSLCRKHMENQARLTREYRKRKRDG